MESSIKAIWTPRPLGVRRAQVADSLKLARIAVVGTVFNLVIAVASIWQPAHAAAILLWAGAGMAAALARLGYARALARHDFASIDDPVLGRIERYLATLATVNGVVWGVGLAIGGFLLDPRHFALLAMLIGGMLGAAVMTYGSLPRAAFAYIGAFAIGGLLAFTLSPNASLGAVLLLMSYVVVLLRTIVTHERNFIAKIEGEAALRESAETVRLLLNDYERQSADWLWSVDAHGHITEAATRFAEASGRDPAVLDGQPLASLFDDTRERTMLAEHLASGFAFRDLTLRLTIAGQPHWWTLSASPRDDGGMRGVGSDVTAQKRAEARVSYMAHYDGLTDLANRFLFNETLQRTLNRTRIPGQVAVLCLDLDQFKSVNDTLGHPVGDRLLCEVARRIEGAVRAGDLVARLGGDEFAVLLPRIQSTAEIEATAGRIIAAIEQPFILDEMQVMTSTSVGIALNTADIDAAAELMKRADLALYAAKSNGRNRHAHYEAGMDEAARERRQLEMDLRGALVRGEFELYYQPLVNIQTGQTVSYEALVRWNHPDRGVIMPAAFIPLAEETGLIVQIGEWVIRQAVAELSHWPRHLRVSVNVSPAQMRSAHLVATVVNAIAHAGIDPTRLELEITEGVLMHDTEVNIAILHTLRDIGVRISLDDFGTGYSSLNYLRSFPFDKIKIDRCFVEDIDSREDCQAIVRAVTGLASSLGMTTTAEGVENEEQMSELRAQGCVEVQGYLFSRPYRPEQFTNLRRKGSETQHGAAPVPLLPATEITPTRHNQRRTG